MGRGNRTVKKNVIWSVVHSAPLVLVMTITNIGASWEFLREKRMDSVEAGTAEERDAQTSGGADGGEARRARERRRKGRRFDTRV